MNFRGFDSSTILILRGGIPRSIGKHPESLSQAMLVEIMLVGRLGVAKVLFEPIVLADFGLSVTDSGPLLLRPPQLRPPQIQETLRLFTSKRPLKYIQRLCKCICLYDYVYTSTHTYIDYVHTHMMYNVYVYVQILPESGPVFPDRASESWPYRI